MAVPFHDQKFTCKFEHTTIKAIHRTNNGTEIEFQLQKLSNYYKILNLPDNVNIEYLSTKLKNDIPKLGCIKNQNMIVKYLEMFSILIYYKELYDKYLQVVQFIEGFISNFHKIHSDDKKTVTTIKKCLTVISKLVSVAESRTNEFVLNIQLTTQPSSCQSTTLFFVPHDLITALRSAEYVCQKLYDIIKNDKLYNNNQFD